VFQALISNFAAVGSLTMIDDLTVKILNERQIAVESSD